LNLTSTYLKKLIIDKAKELGFVQVGFSKAEVLEKESLYLREWLDNGHAADMNWIEKGFEKRRDIRLIMEHAKSVISLAYNYYTPFEHDESLPKISRYAWGKDYHKILKKKLKELCEYTNETTNNPPFIPPLNQMGEERTGGFKKASPQPTITQNEGDSRFRGNVISYVDDGPVMDKVWAVKSGIGAMGKHTNVINTSYGSWIFLCNIITNIEFDSYDSPIEDLCGSCTLCISACPTGAIIDEYKIDANLCISYQTIENRGDIPDSINLDGWIFGCDVCQDVCPYNSPKYNHPSDDLNFYPKKELLQHNFSPPFNQRGEERSSGGFKTKDDDATPKKVKGIATLPLAVTQHVNCTSPPFTKGGQGGFKNKEQLNSFTEEEFTVIFANSPVKRTKYKGWKRNLNKS